MLIPYNIELFFPLTGIHLLRSYCFKGMHNAMWVFKVYFFIEIISIFISYICLHLSFNRGKAKFCVPPELMPLAVLKNPYFTLETDASKMRLA